MRVVCERFMSVRIGTKNSAEEHVFELVDCALLHVRQHMRVRIERKLYAGVSERFRHDLRVFAGGQQ